MITDEPDLLLRRVGLRLTRLSSDIAPGAEEKVNRTSTGLPQFVAEVTAQSIELAQSWLAPGSQARVAAALTP